jgi:hypothetical protein
MTLNGLDMGQAIEVLDERTEKLAEAQFAAEVDRGRIMAELGKLHTALVSGLGSLGSRLASIDGRLENLEQRFSSHRQKLESIPEELEVTANRVVRLHEGERAIERAADWGKMTRNIVATVVAGLVIAVIVFMAGRLTK